MTNAEMIEAKGINLKNRTHGSVKVTCPECSEARKNKKDPCLSVDIDSGVWNCHNCGFKGRVLEKKHKQYVPPVARLEKLSSKALSWFEKDRNISNNTLLRFSITEAKEWMPQFESEAECICFNYFRGEDLVNIKFRGPKKSFKMAKDAELLFYNLNGIQDEDECVIVEGEIDCLTLYECGIYNAVSVPNGASKGSQKLEYLDNCWEQFKDKKKVILMVDADAADYSLRDELARRIGKEVCWRVEYPEGCKDANEVLVKYGKQAVTQMLELATPWPIEGVLTMEDLYDDVVNFYEHGYPLGIKMGLPEFDQLISFMPGQLTVVTGIPGSGKSEFIDLIMCLSARNHDWSWAVCSFENQPSSLHVTKLLEKFTGKAFGFRKNLEARIAIKDLEYGIFMVDKYFHFINISQVEVTLTALLSKAKELVVRKGIKGLLIDPWNYIEHKIPAGQTETQYVSECLTEIKTFALKTDVHVFLIAHPTKMPKDRTTGKYEVPTLYNISGSAHFFSKPDNGICVYRDFSTGLVDVHVQKVRYSWLGKVGNCSFKYDTETRQYKEVII
ncbi:MAG: bifunctional DNA primase/helicase [Chitinophagaceae bacterium]